LKRDEASAILRPAFQDRKIVKREFVRTIEAMHHFLARCAFHVLRPGVEQVQALFEQRPSLTQISRRFCFQDERNFLRKIAELST
jgi:hypothetical protein